MDRKTKSVFDILIFFSLLIVSLPLVIKNSDNRMVLSTLTLILVLSFVLRRINISFWKYKHILTVSFLFDLICVSSIVFFDAYDISYIFFYLLAADALILYFSRLSLVITALSYLLFISIEYTKYIKYNYFDLQYLLPVYTNKTFYFIFLLGAMYIAGYQIKSKQILRKTADDLKIKTIQLEEINKKYRETMEALESVTALKERNRIASEIHDTVGHTLTTVLIEMEAGKRLLSKNYEKALEKLNLAQEQVRKGLDDIRNSVRTLKEGNDILSIIPSLYLLVQETERHTGVNVKCLFSPLPPVSNKVGKVLYKGFQEGLTNGIRHGQSTEFVCSLNYIEDSIFFSLKDNGKGIDKIMFGYGLTIMKERVEELGGSLDICSQKGQGCCLTIEIPVRKGDQYETNSNSDS
jgi:signal transduction histidine kinase